MFDKISSGKIYGSVGNTFAAIEIDGDGVVIRNAADEYDSSGNLITAGSDQVISAHPITGTTINASYIKTGVIDANLMRAGLIQTVPSWNTKWYGAPEDHAAVQMGFTGGSIAATAVSTGTGTVSLTLPGGHGLITGDYVRVSGLFFTTGTLLGGVGLNLPTNGPLDYASATVATNTLTYSKTDITSGLTASTASTVYVGKAHAITAVVRSFDNPENPAELSTVVVTTSAAHGFSVGNYVELVNVAPTIDGVAYITAVTSTTFTFKQRFGADIELDLSGSDLVLPSLSAPVAIKVLKSYTQNADGSIHITSGTVDSTLIVGEIAATEITIGSGEGVVRVGTNVSPAFQGIWAGSANPSTAEFSVNTDGALVATSGSIGGFTLSSTSLTAGTGASAVGLLPGTFPFFAGSSTASTAPFRVTSAGAVTASNLTVTGGSITLDNFVLSTTGQITSDLVLQQTRITNDSGVTIIDTDSDGEKSTLFGGAALREIQTGVANGSFAEPPPSPYANVGSANKLPYWTFTDVNSAGAITAAIVADSGVASGNLLRFTIASGTTAGKSATLSRFIPVQSSANRSFSFYSEASLDTGANTAQATVKLTCQFYKNDQATTTGSSFESATYTFADLQNTGLGITAPDLYPIAPAAAPLLPATAPADASFLKVTVTISTVAQPISNVARTLTTATITTSSVHGFTVGQPVTIALTGGPTGYAALNGTWTITATALPTTFTFTTVTSGTIASGAATGGATYSSTVARSVDLNEVRVASGSPELLITDKNDPATYAPALITAEDGSLGIASGSQDVIYVGTDSGITASNTVTLSAGGAVNISGATNVNLTAPSGVNVYSSGSTKGTLNAADVYGTTAMWSPYLISEAGLSSTLNLRASSGQVLIQDSNVANGTNPRLAFYDKSGTAYATVKSGAVGVVQILSGTSTTTYGQLWAARIYPMNGTSASRYISDDGTRTTFSGGIDVNASSTMTSITLSGALTATGTITGSNQASYVRTDISSSSTTSIPAGSFQSHSLSWTSTVNTPNVVASAFMTGATTVAMSAVVFAQSATSATVYLYNLSSAATTVGRRAQGIAVI